MTCALNADVDVRLVSQQRDVSAPVQLASLLRRVRSNVRYLWLHEEEGATWLRQG
jgi:hypothetical protein